MFSKLLFAERLILNDKNLFHFYFPGYKASSRLAGEPSVIKNRKVIKAFATYIPRCGPVVDEDVRMPLLVHQIPSFLLVVNVIEVPLVKPHRRILNKRIYIT